MNKVILTGIMCLAFILCAFSEDYTVNYVEHNATGHLLEFVLNDYSIKEVGKDGAFYSEIKLSSPAIQRLGSPKLPMISRGIAVSNRGKISVQILHAEYTEIELEYPLILQREYNESPDVKRINTPEIMETGLFPSENVEITDPFIFRDVRGVCVKIYPFQYIENGKVLRVMAKCSIQVNDSGIGGSNPLTAHDNRLTKELLPAYKAGFINYENIASRDLEYGEYGDILVINTPRDNEVIQPYIDWKMKKGYKVYQEIVEPGSAVADIVQQHYDANNDLLYVQLVGDWEDVESIIGGALHFLSCADPMLGMVAGDDTVPDLAIGRFSADSPADVTAQVNKVIQYEKETVHDADWLERGVSVTGWVSDGTGQDDDEAYDTHMNIIRDYKLLPYTYTSIDTIFKRSYASPASVLVEQFDNGIGIMNYCGHGGYDGFENPDFRNSDARLLSNGPMYPFIIASACELGEFDHPDGECVGEEMLRNPTGGAIACLMASCGQSHTTGVYPGMFGQDYFNDLITGGYDYDTNPGEGISTSDLVTHFGPAILNMSFLMWTEYPYIDTQDIIEHWTTFGDASLQIRTKAPELIELSNTQVIAGAQFGTYVTMFDGDTPVEGAVVCLYQDSISYAGVTGQDGAASFSHSLAPGQAILTVTGYNLVSRSMEITVLSPDGPVIQYNPSEFNFGEVQAGEVSDQVLHIANTGTGNLSAMLEAPQGFLLRCPPAEFWYDAVSFIIGDGESIDIGVRFTPEESIEYTGSLGVFSNSVVDGELYIPLSGTGIGNGVVNANQLARKGFWVKCSPNPFNPVTTINYNISNSGKVQIEIFNIKGQIVKTLLNQWMEAGTYSVRWDGKSNSYEDVTSGIYFYRIITQGESTTGKMLLMK